METKELSKFVVPTELATKVGATTSSDIDMLEASEWKFISGRVDKSAKGTDYCYMDVKVGTTQIRVFGGWLGTDKKALGKALLTNTNAPDPKKTLFGINNKVHYFTTQK